MHAEIILDIEVLKMFVLHTPGKTVVIGTTQC